MEYKTLELSKISLDLENPRHEPFDTEAEVIAHLCDKEKGQGKIIALAKNIAENGLNPFERIAVIEKKDGSFICVEGNRRICALKLLNNPKLSPKSCQDDFDEISKEFDAWKEIKQLYVAKFEETDEDHKKIEIWLNRTHAGPDQGRGRLQWNSEQKARHNENHQGKFALAVLDYAEEQGFILKSERAGRISTVRNWLSYSIMLDTLGLKARDDASLKNLSGAKLIAFKKFIADVFAKNINSWTNKDEAEDYAKKLINNNDVTDKNISNESLTSTVSPIIKTSTKSTKFKKRTKIKSNSELEKALKELDIYKLQKIYYSLCKIDFKEHAPLLYVGSWSFLETLTALFSERGKRKFSDYLNLKEIISLSIVKSNDASAVFQAVERICNVGNTTKHNKTAAGFDGEQLANDFEEMNPLLVYLVKKAIKEKKQS
ncbi:MAG: hypothetical protein K8953_09420 [Proteobacteria bacterium]|nr:hypothetical protein [Pseudomonadota bacterium]